MKTNKKLFQLSLPVYDLKSQLEYITTICKELEFDGDRLISYILADWIYTVQSGFTRKMDMQTIFVKYLKHIESQHKAFNKLKKELENASSKKPTE